MSNLISMKPGQFYYPGVVVGGPYNGRQMAHESDLRRVPILPEVPSAAVPYGVVPSDHKATTFNYVWVEGLRGTFEINFWVPEGKNAAWALEQMAGSFVQARTDKDMERKVSRK